MLKFLLDEDTPGPLESAIRRHNLRPDRLPIDFVRVGRTGAPPSGTTDPDNLIWAEAEDRILVSRDFNTLIQHLNDHLAAGRHSPGVLLIRPGHTYAQIISELEAIAHAGQPDDFRDRVQFIPL
jgi:hypothetical protein